jgi:signal transduction histidine kinase
MAGLPPRSQRSAYAHDFVSLFQNLISNAIKYRRAAAPRIHISVQREEDELRFAVSDNGVGIEPKFHEEVFAPFKRLHNRNIAGTGLGLAICQRVVNRYGGRIRVESTAGNGATFVFTVPDTTIDSIGDLK